MMRFLALLFLVAILEVVVFVQVQSVIGLGWALLIIVATTFIGAFLVKRTGLSVLRRARQKLDNGQMPGRELSDGAAVVVAGLLLIPPGFITDIAGFLLLLPPVRELVYRAISQRVTGKVTVIRSSVRTIRRDAIEGEIIDVEAIEDGSGTN
jgi:UPF0716 protein FxsA